MTSVTRGSPETRFEEDKCHNITVALPLGGFGDRAVTRALLQGGRLEHSDHSNEPHRNCHPASFALEKTHKTFGESPLIREFTNRGLYAVVKEDKLITF